MSFKGANWTIALGIIVSILFAGCKKNPIQYKFQADTAIYFSFKNNSQWVYQNSINTSQFDTVTGNSSASGFADRDGGQVEIASITLNGIGSPQMIIRAEAIATQSVDRIAVLTNFNKALYPSPVILNIAGNMSTEGSDSIKIIPNLMVGNVTYENVIEVSLKDHPVYKKLWFGKNSGIIKKKLLDDAIFDLISYTPGS